MEVENGQGVARRRYKEMDWLTIEKKKFSKEAYMRNKAAKEKKASDRAEWRRTQAEKKFTPVVASAPVVVSAPVVASVPVAGSGKRPRGRPKSSKNKK